MHTRSGAIPQITPSGLLREMEQADSGTQKTFLASLMDYII